MKTFNGVSLHLHKSRLDFCSRSVVSGKTGCAWVYPIATATRVTCFHGGVFDSGLKVSEHKHRRPCCCPQEEQRDERDRWRTGFSSFAERKAKRSGDLTSPISRRFSRKNSLKSQSCSPHQSQSTLSLHEAPPSPKQTPPISRLSKQELPHPGPFGLPSSLPLS